MIRRPVIVKRRIVTPHRVVGSVSLVVGLSFFFERYQLVSRALATPFSLLDWVPFVTGQHAWGIAFTLGGLLILTSFHLLVRTIALTMGAFSWAVLGTPALYEAYLGPLRHETGGFAGILSATMVLLCLVAARRVRDDFFQPPAEAAKVPQ